MNSVFKIINLVGVYGLLCLIIPHNLFAQEKPNQFYNKLKSKHLTFRLGALERMDTSQKKIYLAFTGHEYNDGGKKIRKTLKRFNVQAHFFFTGDFYRTKSNKKLIHRLKNDGHYLGPHSDKHLLYVSWENRDSLLIDKAEFLKDVLDNYHAMEKYGIKRGEAEYFMPPYEWYNQQIANWTEELGLILVNFTPGTRSNADYTTPEMKNYISSEMIFEQILTYEEKSSSGLNGFILLIHLGTHPSRTDKFYDKLPKLIRALREKGYTFSLLP